MRVFIAGATGALGAATVRAFREAGDEVVALSRSAENETKLRALGATAARGDLFDPATLVRPMETCAAVLRLATHIPADPKARPRAWALNDRIRRDGTRALLDAANRAGVQHYLQEGIVWARPTGVTRSALDAERLAAGQTTLRLGWLYGATSSQTRAFAAMLQKGRLAVVGRGDAPLAFLHVEDAARAFVLATHRGARGVFDVAAHPATSAEFFDLFAAKLGARTPRRIAPWLARFAIGRAGVEFLTTPMQADARRFVGATGWVPRYPTVAEGLDEVIRALPPRA